MIVGVNKCNITNIALEEANKLFWGFRCKDSRAIFLENYMQYLKCSTLSSVTCYPDNCVNPTIHNTCNIIINAISFSIVGNVITFFIDPSDLIGATNPLQYAWGYEPDVFDLISTSTNNSTLVVKLKDGIVLDDLVTPTSVVITDANGCHASKLCYLAEGSIICADDYTPCPNITNLVVSNSSIPFFRIIANGLQSILNTSWTISSTGTYTVNWGDGTVDSFGAGSTNPIHTYDSPYTGYIIVSSNSLNLITGLVMSSNNITPNSGAVTILTSEVSKLTGLLGLSLGDQVFLDGIVTDLPSGLTALGITNTNLSGDIADLASTLLTVTITGLNTLHGNIVDLPTGLTSLTIWGLNTITGDVINLPRNITIFNVHGSNTISGTPVGLPPSLVLTDLLGSNTMSGDIAGWPSTSTDIVVFGNNTLFGSIANLPSGTTHFSILGNNTITGSLGNMPTTITFFQVTGHNTISGNLAAIPSAMTFINVSSTASTVNHYSIAFRTWNSAMNSVIIVAGSGGFLAAQVDAILNELAAQVSSWIGDNRRVILTGGSDPRTAASNAAVATLTGFSVTVATN